MTSNINPIQMIQIIQRSKNPEEFVLGMLERRSQNNPIMANLLALARQNKTSDIEQIARNMLKEQGKDFDTEFANFKQRFGL